MFSYMNYHIKKASVRYTMAAVVALTYLINQSPGVSAQFYNCALDPTSGLTVCLWPESPLLLTDTVGSTIFSLDNSRLYSVCSTAGSYSLAECSCAIYIYNDPLETLELDNYCSTCKLTSITFNSFTVEWDCSNRLGGNCPIYNSNGCQIAAGSQSGSDHLLSTIGGIFSVMLAILSIVFIQ